MPFRLEPLDIVLIVVVALLIFGPRQLPQIGRGIGRAISEFRQGAKEMAEGFRDEATGAHRPKSTTPAAPSPQPGGAACPQCGGRNAPDGQFCTHCGVSLVSVPNESGNLNPPAD